jgi:hypothetical protein
MTGLVKKFPMDYISIENFLTRERARNLAEIHIPKRQAGMTAAVERKFIYCQSEQ